MQHVAQSVVKLQGKNEISMNPAWTQHEFNMNSKPCCSPNIYWNCQNFPDFLRRFGLAVWIWSQKKCFLTYFREMHESSMNPAWIQHEWIFQIFFDSSPNHQSKPPLKQIWSDFFWPFFKKNIESDSCRFHAGCMLNSCIFRRVTLYFHSCQIHVRFMLNSCIFNDSEIWCWIGSFSKILVQIWLGRGWCWIHAEFMLISSLPWSFTTLCATFCITLVLNSCWIHAEFMQNHEKYLNLPIKWQLKHLTGLFMLYTIRNTVWDFSKNC